MRREDNHEGDNCKRSQSAKFQLSAFYNELSPKHNYQSASRCHSAFHCFLSFDCRGRSIRLQTITKTKQDEWQNSDCTSISRDRCVRRPLRPCSAPPTRSKKKTKTWTTCGVQSTQIVWRAISVTSIWGWDGGRRLKLGWWWWRRRQRQHSHGSEDLNVNMDVANETPN